LNDAESRELQRIVRRGGKTDRSIVRWRRAMVVLASAGGNDVAAIARLVQASADRVREMIHRFDDLGMRSLDPQWAGGRPRLITMNDPPDSFFGWDDAVDAKIPETIAG
jgi:hypothetical protein